jgi:hypothetical protein
MRDMPDMPDVPDVPDMRDERVMRDVRDKRDIRSVRMMRILHIMRTGEMSRASLIVPASTRRSFNLIRSPCRQTRCDIKTSFRIGTPTAHDAPWCRFDTHLTPAIDLNFGPRRRGRPRRFGHAGRRRSPVPIEHSIVAASVQKLRVPPGRNPRQQPSLRIDRRPGGRTRSATPNAADPRGGPTVGDPV